MDKGDCKCILTLLWCIIASMTTSIAILSVIILIISVVIHEVAHGYAAYKLGDSTAYRAGRLSLNPLVHLSWIGSVLLPFLLISSGSPVVFGYAKPVPYNPYNLSNRRWGEVIVALAGPVSNLILAIIFGLVLRTGLVTDLYAVQIISMIALTNLALMVFNLVPVPPLDGSKVLYSLFPGKPEIRNFLERNSILLVLLFIFFGWRYIAPVVYWIFNVIVGA